MTPNMIKVFGFSEEFTPKQQIIQYFTNLIQQGKSEAFCKAFFAKDFFSEIIPFTRDVA